MNPAIDAAALADTAHAMLCEELERRDNVLSPMHSAALFELVSAFSMYAIGEVSGRRAFGLATGLGKSTAVVQWIAACHRMGYRIPVAVSASRVEALCAMRNDLIAAGVPIEDVGIKHSMKPRQASVDSTGDTSYLVQLVTHSRVRNDSLDRKKGLKNYALFGTHEGKPRALMIFDESLMRGDGGSVNYARVNMALGALARSPACDSLPIVQQASAFMEECCGIAKSAIASLTLQGDPQGVGCTVEFPERQHVEIQAYQDAIQAAIDGDNQSALLGLLDICQDTIRVLVTTQGAGILWATVAVPPELKNIAILDASDPIRELVRLDSSIVSASSFADNSHRPLKTFEKVSITQIVAGGGRTMMTRKFRGEQQRSACREFIEIIQSEYATARRILICTFLPRGGFDMRRVLEGEMRVAGMKLDAPVSATDSRRKIEWRTWGSHDSENGLEECDVVLAVGTLYRSHLDIASAAQAQSMDPRFPTTHAMLEKLVQSEAASALYQLASRGACRRVRNGSAEPMKLYFVDRSKSIRDVIDRVMPEASWTFREPVHMKQPKQEGIADQLAALILNHLRGLDESISKVSSRTVKRALALDPADTAGERAFTRAVGLVDQLSGSGWTTQERSFVRWAEVFRS